MEEIWENYENVIFKGINRYVPHKALSKNPDSEYCNREVKRLKVKVRKMYNSSKLVEEYLAQLIRLSKELLVAKKTAKEKFYNRSYKRMADAGQSSISMLGDTKEIERVFWRTGTMKASWSQIQ